MESSAAGWRLEGMPRNDKRLPPSTVGSYHVCAREGGARVIDRERFFTRAGSATLETFW